MTVYIPPECTTKFLKSANTPHLKSGCEPRVLYAAGFLAFFAVIGLRDRWGLMLGAFLFLFIRALGRWMARRDPYMTVLVSESQKYGRFYPTRAMQPIRIRRCR